MEVTITQFRKELFSLVSQAMDGAEVWIKHKGGRVKLMPEKPVTDRFSRATPMRILNPPNVDINDPAFKAQWLAEMEAEWTKDWDRDFGSAITGEGEEQKNGSGS